MAETRRQGRFSEPGERVPLSFRVTPEFKRRIDQAAAVSGRSTAQEIELRLEASLADAAFPAEIAALTELLGRVMTETGNAISGANRWSGHAFNKPWLADPYAYSQAVAGAIHVLRLSLPSDTCEPHGLFASPDYPKERAQQMGKQVADGILEVMRGRHTDDGATAVLWSPRVREKLGVIGDRLDRQPEPEEYWVPTRSTDPVDLDINNPDADRTETERDEP